MFNATRALGVTYKGISLETLAKEAGTGYSNTVKAAGMAIEKRYPAVVEAKIQYVFILSALQAPHPQTPLPLAEF
ncbi:hypothetical protein MAP00_004279 [Monascus purpureus]|nr:hypothetical protein MAP00_004279 [Monascus purpureus]